MPCILGVVYFFRGVVGPPPIDVRIYLSFARGSFIPINSTWYVPGTLFFAGSVYQVYTYDLVVPLLLSY